MNQTDQEQIEHVSLESVGIVLKPECTDEIEQCLREYFSVFAKPGKPKSSNGFTFGFPCLHCGEPLTGMLGTFTWSLAWGECKCGKCGWPGRAHHVIKDTAGEEFLSLSNVVLQYHPDSVESPLKELESMEST